MKIKELIEERGRVVAEARAIIDKADAEKRALNDEELAQHKKLIQRAQNIKAQIEAAQAQEEEERQAAVRHDEEERSNGNRNGDAEEQRAERQAEAFALWLRSGSAALTPEQGAELRALAQDVQTEGGYLVAPQKFVEKVIMFLNDAVYVRSKATVIKVVGAQSLGAPALKADPSDPDWTNELATGSEDSSMEVGKRELIPHALAKRLLVSNKLIRNAPRSEDLVRERLGYKFSIAQEKAFLTGSGSNQPLGLMTASTMGISTSRDVSTGNQATSIEFDGLQSAKYGLKLQYRQSKSNTWVFHRDAVEQIAKLKDNYGRYLWQPSVVAGQPDRLLNIPVAESEYMPNTFTTGKYVGLLGDLSYYWIVDNLQMQFQRLVELYAESNQIGFIGRLESDGMPVLEEAFVRVKLA